MTREEIIAEVDFLLEKCGPHQVQGLFIAFLRDASDIDPGQKAFETKHTGLSPFHGKKLAQFINKATE